MEMMVVLLIMSIIMAASAPIVSRKMSKSGGTGNASPWVFTDNRGNIAYNMGGKRVTAIIGAATLPASAGNPRLYIDCGDNADAQITFGHGDEVARVIADPINWRVGISSAAIPNTSVAFGGGQTITGTSSVTIGQGASNSGTSGVVIGSGANISSDYNNESSIVIGTAANANNRNNVAIGPSVSNTGVNSVALGHNTNNRASDNVAIGANVSASTYNTVAIGNNIDSTNSNTVAIGANPQTQGDYSIAIGGSRNSIGPRAQARSAIAIGANSLANGAGAIAIGSVTKLNTHSYRTTSVTADYSMAIGVAASASGRRSTAIGYRASSTTDDQIVLGNSETTVFIPGNLIVGCNSLLGLNQGNSVYLRESTGNQDIIRLSKAPTNQGLPGVMYASEQGSASFGGVDFTYQRSDRHLKNVGEKYTAGLDELKKLELYHFTYKKDETKTPHVGVIAQDLQKVFPDAISKDADGYLTIRLEDMFYAVVNAVRELDAKICAIADDITGMKSEIKELKEQNAEFQARITELEKLVKEKN